LPSFIFWQQGQESAAPVVLSQQAHAAFASGAEFGAVGVVVWAQLARATMKARTITLIFMTFPQHEMRAVGGGSRALLEQRAGVRLRARFGGPC
jgi:hypothetical protein